jgi:hypothetical protein
MTLLVTIKDREAIKSITVKQIKNYIESKDWIKKEDRIRTYDDQESKIVAEIYVKDLQFNASDTVLLIPTSESFGDYTARVSEILFTLEKYENRSQLEIYSDIIQKSIVIRPNKIK